MAVVAIVHDVPVVTILKPVIGFSGALAGGAFQSLCLYISGERF